MKTFSLACSNCSAPLDVPSDSDRFACAHCGSPQQLMQSGGTVSLRKVESAINAVQRGTDRTAAELALPRLKREREVALQNRSEVITSLHNAYDSASRGRNWIALFAVLFAFIFGGYIKSNLENFPIVSSIFNYVWLAMAIAAAWLVFRKIRLPVKNTSPALVECDARLAHIDAHIQANRTILDRLPH